MPSADLSELDEQRSTPDHAGRHADRADLAQRLKELPARQRAVIVLRFYEGLSDPEIADVLGCSAGTVRGYASRGLAALRVDITRADLTELAVISGRESR